MTKTDVVPEVKHEINDMPLCECANTKSHHAVFSSVQYEMLSKKHKHITDNNLDIMRIDCFRFRDEDYEVLEETEHCKIVSYKKKKVSKK